LINDYDGSNNNTVIGNHVETLIKLKNSARNDVENNTMTSYGIDIKEAVDNVILCASQREQPLFPGGRLASELSPSVVRPPTHIALIPDQPTLPPSSPTAPPTEMSSLAITSLMAASTWARMPPTISFRTTHL
jgi:hypothetical protein